MWNGVCGSLCKLMPQYHYIAIEYWNLDIVEIEPLCKLFLSLSFMVTLLWGLFELKLVIYL